jgi:hypothetical protein
MVKREDLAAIEEIKQLKARYCRCVDTKDWELFGTLFASDATLDLRDFQFGRDPATGERTASGTIPFEALEAMTEGIAWPVAGREAIRAFCSAAMGPVTSVHHLLVGEIDIVSPTTAGAVWPMEDYTWQPAGSPVSSMHGLGHYHETYELVDGAWLVKTVKLSRIRVEWH